MTEIGLKAPLPVHPQPGFYETTVVNVEHPGSPAALVTHLDIEEIAAQKPWDIRDLQAKATANLVLRGWKRNEHGIFVEPPPALPRPRESTENIQRPKATKATGTNRSRKPHRPGSRS